MTHTTGYTYDLTTDEQRRNEHAAVLEMCALHPHNEYWANRLIALQTAEEVESDLEWLTSTGLELDGSETGISQPVIF